MEGQIYLQPQEIWLTGSFKYIFQELELLATHYATIKDLRRELQSTGKSKLDLPPVVYGKN